jgi:pyruvate/2-oxoglutarate dehydrogenase complex dihydrolipoamide dehydrogenase (E3) component
MKYDAIIVGSGQAGNPLAFRLADLGWSVALVEEKNLGGTCINVGCTPTKTMVHRARFSPGSAFQANGCAIRRW